MTHAENVAEMVAQLEAHFPDCAVVVEDDDGYGYELTDCSFENVDGRDQVLVKIARLM